jgi:hypothetical protein
LEAPAAAGWIFDRQRLKCRHHPYVVQEMPPKENKGQIMLMRTIVTIAAVLVLGIGNGFADAPKARRHNHHAHIVSYEPQGAPPAPYNGPTLVLHPANNIACNTPYRSARALPCDQPVWVYGSPCEVDLGLGRYRSCY